MFAIEKSSLGRIVIPRSLSEGKAIFYTTLDFDGHLDRDVAQRISDLIRERFAVESTLNTCKQVHGARVERRASARRQRAEARRSTSHGCDALWSDEQHVALGIKIADCLPVTLIDRQTIANIHSGWRGAVQRITAVTLDTIERESSFDSTSACAYLGPTIRVCCFEVGEEVAAQFPSSVVDRRHARPHVDVAALTVDLLRQRGFAPERIFDSGLCTRCDGSIFHSFRREGKGGGRNLAIVAQ